MLLTLLAIRHKTRHVKFMAGIPLIIIFQAAILVFVFNQSLSVSHYSVETDKINGQIKLALVTDLHACKYGYGQSELLNVIDGEAPDMILLCGDIFDDKLPPDRAIEFIEGVSRKYMCFYVSGNHEFWSEKVDEFKDILISCGVIVLAGKTEIVDVRSGLICIMGIDDPYVDKYISNSVSYAEQISRLSDHADNEAFAILLSHRPERIYELLPLKADLIVSGHAHGGQWRIPYVLQNGLYSPNQGLFPKYTNGEYFFEDAELIVSRGLARESIPVPRVFNRPEIVIITLEQESF
jgi:predicted MPP superfamily phosphohydrolase